MQLAKAHAAKERNVVPRASAVGSGVTSGTAGERLDPEDREVSAGRIEGDADRHSILEDDHDGLVAQSHVVSRPAMQESDVAVGLTDVFLERSRQLASTHRVDGLRGVRGFREAEDQPRRNGKSRGV